MKSKACELVGCEFPLFAFSHCRDVVAAVSKAGGYGVLGAVGHSPESLEIELSWIDEHVDGHPYGVDLIVPTSIADREGTLTAQDLIDRVPDTHKRHVEHILATHGIDTADLWDTRLPEGYGDNMRESGASAQLEVALNHPITSVVNALGAPPKFMVDAARAKGIAVGALTGSREHALKNVEAGVDFLVVSGTEAGGHCGEISTLVVVPEVIETLRQHNMDVPVLAAGGIVTGKQMAACMMMGAAGAWCGSVWLTTTEAETLPSIKEKMLSANSRQTVRSKSRTGKYTRQLRSPWTDAWQGEAAPEPLPMPLQGLVSGPPLRRIDKLAESGHAGARQLATYWVGQGVGLMNDSLSARTVVMNFMEDFAGAYEQFQSVVED
ncbi:MAG: nitronate monooxygenase [Gammaproteobacteria bacterium]|jgi:NAD(P)H-dependent flavin oxidoreductase YrpB (nitropropane dioxygenase family)|nr:nitronate monooxygenase [Gammaproteobacteria bacterium]MCH1550649.1 nitronate monooxygenase [Pseudomonadales bacterium]